MKVFDRFQSALFNPGRIPSFENDTKKFTLLYFIILVVLMLIPTVISVALVDDLDYRSEVAIRKEFMTSEVVPYEIIDNNLVTKQDIGNLNQSYHIINYSNWVFYFTVDGSFVLPTENISKTNILLYKDGIYLYTPFQVSLIIKYTDYAEFEGLDFSLAVNNNKIFYNQLYRLINKIIDDYRGVYITKTISEALAEAIVTLLIGSLVLTVFGRFGENNYFKFSKHWQLMIYAMTPLIVGNILAVFFNSNLLYYIGLFMTLIYSFGINQNPNRGGKKNEF